MKIDLRKVFVENITYFYKNKTIFGKERPWKPWILQTHTCVYVHTLKLCACMLTACARIHHAHAYMGMHMYARVLKTM